MHFIKDCTEWTFDVGKGEPLQDHQASWEECYHPEPSDITFDQYGLKYYTSEEVPLYTLVVRCMLV